MLAEYSGRPLARYKLMHNLKMYVMSALFCTLFLYVDTGAVWANVLIFLELPRFGNRAAPISGCDRGCWRAGA